MKKIVKIAVMLLVALPLTACYEKYTHDYESPNMGFSLQRPLRTVVSDINKIYVGVSIGGKREVDMSDWARFEIDASLLDGTGLTLMPAEYYVLADPDTFRVRKSNLAVADVGIIFTEAFYADENALKKYYAIPFRVTATSIPGDPETQPDGAIREGGEYSVVAVKYISGYSGTYYRLGEMTEVDAAGMAVGEPVVYEDKDLIKNPTCAFTTLRPDVVVRPGMGSLNNAGSLQLTVDESQEGGNVRVEAVPGGATLTAATGRYVTKGDFTFHSSDIRAPQFELEYTFQTTDGKSYKVSERLVLRQYPEQGLRVETY